MLNVECKGHLEPEYDHNLFPIVRLTLSTIWPAAPARHCVQVLVVSALVCMGGGSKGESSNLSAQPHPKNI